MINKKDLRYLKTEKLIKDTYLSLRKKNKKNIKVNELCNEALINKSTFYAHYETIEIFHQKFCKEIVDNIINNSSHIDCAISDTKSFVISLVESLKRNEKLISILFDDRLKLINLVEDNLLQRYLKMNDFKGRENELIFAIGGATRLLIHDQSKDRIEATIKLIQMIIL